MNLHIQQSLISSELCSFEHRGSMSEFPCGFNKYSGDKEV